MQEVNLIPDTELGTSQGQRRGRLVVTITVVCLVIYCLFLAGLFAYRFTVSKDLRDMRSSRKPVEEKINQLSRKEWLIRSIVSKVDKIDAIFRAEPPFAKIISRLVELEPSGITYTDVALTAPNKVVVSGQATNLGVLDTFLSEVTAKEYGRKVFSDIVLQSLLRNDRGGYEFSLRFTYIGS